MMKLAIHYRKGTFSDSKDSFNKRWIDYCESKGIPYKLVDAYSNDIIEQTSDCDCFLWHHSHSHPKDILFAKQLLFSLEAKEIKVFPNYYTAWHFDDKVGQKYLLEAIKAPLVKSYVFYSKVEALAWLETTSFPKVFKLRGGAGAKNVKLVKTKRDAKKLISKAFGKGFRQYEPISNLKERWRLYKKKQTNFYNVFKGVLRFFKEPEYSKTIGYERGYIYFQDFIPNNNSDTRVIVIGNRAFAVKRMTRDNDFRASGSGVKKYERENIDLRTVKMSFDIAKRLKSDSIAFDFVFDVNNTPLIIEICYAFAIEFYDPCPGFWDEKLKWHEGEFIPQNWMIEDLMSKLEP